MKISPLTPALFRILHSWDTETPPSFTIANSNSVMSRLRLEKKTPKGSGTRKPLALTFAQDNVRPPADDSGTLLIGAAHIIHNHNNTHRCAAKLTHSLRLSVSPSMIEGENSLNLDSFSNRPLFRKPSHVYKFP